MSDILSAAATVAGMIPGGQIIGAALGVADALGAGDWLTKHVLGGKGAAVAQAVVAATQAATGGPTDPTAVKNLDPDKQAVLKVQLAQIAAQQEAEANREADAARQALLDEMKARLEDTAGARTSMVQLAQAGSRLSWAPVVISTIVLVSFGVILYTVLNRVLPDNDVVKIMLGTLGGMASQVVAFWVGSSIGSQSKDASLANSVPIHALQAMQGGGQTNRPLSR